MCESAADKVIASVIENVCQLSAETCYVRRSTQGHLCESITDLLNCWLWLLVSGICLRANKFSWCGLLMYLWSECPDALEYKHTWAHC